MAQSNNSHYFMATPQDFLSTPYGYAGQMSPETAVAEQALNRRRYLANLLTQQGLQTIGQAPSGQMVGRFYVGASPLQGFANLAQGAVGLGLGLHQMNQIDTQQSDLAKADRQSVVDAIQAYQDKIKQKQQLAAAPVGVPTTPPSSPPPGPAAGSTEAAIPQPEAFRGIAPAQPPDEHTGVSDFRARPDTLPFGQNPSGVSQTITPGDMSQFANSANPAMAQEQLGTQAPPSAAPAAPVPIPQPAPAQPYRPTMNDLADLLTHQHPTVRAYGQLLAQQMMQEQEHQRNQGNLDRTYNLDKDRLAATNKLAEAQLASRDAYQQAALGQQGDLTRATQAIAQQRADTDAAQAAASAQANKIAASLNQSKLAEDIRHNKATEAAALARPTAKDEAKLAEQEKSKQDVEGIISVLRDSYNQLRAGGGVTDTTQPGLANMGAAASSSGVGQALGKTFGTQNQSYRNTIAQQRPILMGNISKALGMSAKQLDSNAELKLWLNAATDPTLDYQTNMRALDQLESMLGRGGQPQGAPSSSSAGAPGRSVTRTGMHNGKKVIQYSDGSIEYAP